MLRDELNSPGRGSLAILLLVVLTEGTALFTHAFVLSRAQLVPGWIPLLGGRPVRPSLVVGALLAPIIILAVSNLQTIAVVLGTVEPSDGLPAWSLWGQMTLFMVWGCALTAATLAYWRSTPRPVLATA